MAITDWPADERPREKLMQKGAAALSDAELLAIFAASSEQVSAVHGMGTSKYCQLQAIFEMSRRALSEALKRGDVLKSPQQVREYLCLQLGQASREIFMVLFLDAQNRVQAQEALFEGTLTQTSVYPREVVKRALYHNAASVIFAHNHPMGLAQQSQADEVLTQALKNALALVDVRVLDHFIVAGNTTMSFAERGLL